MKYTAQQIAKLLNGKIEGNPKVSVSEISKIEEGREGTLSFLANPKYTPYLYETEASIVLINKDLILEKPVNTTIIRVDDAYQAIASILKLYNQNVLNKKGKESPHHIGKGTKIGKDIYIGAFAYIGDNVKIGKNCKIFPNCFIGDNVKIGDDVTLYPGVKIYHSCKIGNRTVIHSGAVVGSDGFGFAPDENNKYHKIEQIGIVVIKDDVEIGANTTIDRATMGETLIEEGVKLDNLIQVAHNVVIGENTVSASQAGISGTSKIGKNCALGGQVGISGHIKIGDNVKIGAKSGVPSDVESDQAIMGIPAVDAMEFKRHFVLQKRMPELNNKIKKLEKELKELKSKI